MRLTAPVDVPSDPDDPSAASAAIGRTPRLGQGLDRRPLYRVVEYVRDDRGRLHEQGRIWHTDLQRVRQFGRAVADNTAGSRVVIADNAGRVVEELPLPGIEHAAQGAWEGWRDRRLPSLSPASTRKTLRREAPTTPAAAWVLPAEAPAAPARGSAPGLPAPASATASAPTDPFESRSPRTPPVVELPILGEHDEADLSSRH